ncbi:MAG: hypothetical protein JXJ04_06205 [Spirochaetales bacterium]|nr:hypothetical protein [Spirochaetales bacterium]
MEISSINTINNNVEQLTNILRLSAEQSTDLTKKLLKVNIEQMVPEGKTELIGTFVDTSA